MTLSDAVIALERRMARRRELSSLLLSLDGYDRWGNPSDEQREQAMSEAAGASIERDQLGEQLAAAVEALREQAPAEVEAWAQAHVELLDAYVAGLTEAQSTEAFVARGERGEWLEVAAGGKPYVDENTYYVHVDPAAYRARFGFDPR